MSQAIQGSPKTWFSGDSSPDAKRKREGGAILAILAISLALPVAAITAFGSYVAFSKFRIKHTVIFQLTVIVTLLMLITGLFKWSLSAYSPAIMEVFNSVKDEDASVVAAIIKWVAVSAPLSLVAGMIVGSVYCAIRWLRRSVWEEFDFRLTPLESLRLKRSISDIKDGKFAPMDGATIGVNKKGEKIIQTENEASAHTLYTGASGTGKTTTKLTGLRDTIRQGSGAVVIDLKADGSLAETMAEYAERYGRNFYHFSFHDDETEYEGPCENGPSFYDPLGKGDASSRKDMIIGGRVWESDYFQRIASNYLQNAFSVMIKAPHPDPDMDSLSDIIELLQPGALADRARNVTATDYTVGFMREVHLLTSEKLDNNETSTLKGMRHELSVMKLSTAGKWIKKTSDPMRNIDIARAAYNGDVVVFSLDSLAAPATAKMIANFIIGDLKTVASELGRKQPDHPMHIFIDEFAAIGSESITNLINKSRSSLMPTTLATQTLGDLKRVDPAFIDQILGIVNAYVIHRPNTIEEAELLAGLGGREKKWDLTLGVEHTTGVIGGIGKGAATGEGRVNSKVDFTINPDDIMKLGMGECYYIAKSPKARIERVKVIPERDNLTTSGGDNRSKFTHAREAETTANPSKATATEETVDTPKPRATTRQSDEDLIDELLAKHANSNRDTPTRPQRTTAPQKPEGPGPMTRQPMPPTGGKGLPPRPMSARSPLPAPPSRSAKPVPGDETNAPKPPPRRVVRRDNTF